MAGKAVRVRLIPEPSHLPPKAAGRAVARRLADRAAADLDEHDQRSAERFSGLDLSGPDLSSAAFVEFELIGCRLDRTNLSGAHLAECTLLEVDAGPTSPSAAV